MISYKLAKQLKEAGFPQYIKAGGKVYTGIMGHPRRGIPYQYPVTTVFEPEAWDKFADDVIVIPTLSELIEACVAFQGWMITLSESGPSPHN